MRTHWVPLSRDIVGAKENTAMRKYSDEERRVRAAEREAWKRNQGIIKKWQRC